MLVFNFTCQAVGPLPYRWIRAVGSSPRQSRDARAQGAELLAAVPAAFEDADGHHVAVADAVPRDRVAAKRLSALAQQQLDEFVVRARARGMEIDLRDAERLRGVMAGLPEEISRWCGGCLRLAGGRSGSDKKTCCLYIYIYIYRGAPAGLRRTRPGIQAPYALGRDAELPRCVIRRPPEEFSR